jgi:hypothetical protein
VIIVTRGCWRLLAAFSLIWAAPTILRGQDAVLDRSPDLAGGIPLSPSLPPRYFRPPRPIIPQQFVLGNMVRAAGIIFSGRVTFIGHSDSSSRPDPASTTITFQVEYAIRGTAAGQNLTIHEWAGLWSSGERYRVGERVLLFLYSPSKLGLTSPVAGAMGRFATNSQGQIMMSPLHIANLAANPLLGGKTVVPHAEFVRAVRRSSREE